MATLTTDGMLAVASAVGIQTLPAALAIYPRHTDHERLAAAGAAATAELRECGVLDHAGEVRDDDLVAALFVLARPERELIARIRRDGTLIRVCLARRGLEHAIAVRTGGKLEVRTVWGDEDPVVLARQLLAVLGSRPPADIPVVRAPANDLQRRLDAATDYADALYGLGMRDTDAVTLGVALRQAYSVAELVCYSHREGLAVRSPAAAAVYDTVAGRIIGGGNAAPDGQIWTTLAPGTDRRLAQVIAAQLEALPEGRWMP
ncbi:ESX secretion-associated protein EspG [Nocardia sp. NEAU-G5]|uniref:ESX secretion-associated protein EspG n=1 Tax=Nocardia albiluteola TaxID=2842303 RepID=A0ABS6B4M0_9NOCA|nr:ESX secretion-associated protein EspG [Nocardia albiluteola]MBU3065199.1 ESX secretion-associated protein EspG [Nocardia albiluteola]